MKESKEKHPAYKKEDLKIRTPKELERAKKAAGVTSHEEVVKRFAESETKQQEIVFNSEKNISKQDWEGMRGKLNEYRKKEDLGKSLEQATNMKILNPEAEIILTDSEQEKIKDYLEFDRKRGDFWNEISKLFMYVKILDPETDLDITNEEWGKMKDLLKRYSRKEKWDEFSEQAMYMKILDPETDLDINDKEQEGMKDRLETYRSNENWGSFPILAAEMKIIDPEIDLDLTDLEWEGMKDRLEEYHDAEGWNGFAEQAANMKILAEEKKE